MGGGGDGGFVTVLVTDLSVCVTVGLGFGSCLVTLVTVFGTDGGGGVGDVVGAGVLTGPVGGLLGAVPGVPGEELLGEVLLGCPGTLVCVVDTACVLEVCAVVLPACVTRAAVVPAAACPFPATTGSDFAAAAGSCVADTGADPPGPANA